ncbi:MAG: dihydroxy-acid dehydratase [Gammaproteobacteria bacterium]|nr:dihydroxy-acid dehydratase [Gammaproteobacteria bacterium]
MKKPLRSNAANNPTRRAHWLALGISDEDMQKPKIAVVNSSSELAICFSHLDGVARIVKDAIRAAGGLPFEIRTTAPSDFIFMSGGSGYMLGSRDLVVNDIEVPVQGAQLDGMICLTSCDKLPPAHLMAAGRLNIPTILVVCGYQPAGTYDGERVDIEDLWFGSVQHNFGKLDAATLQGMSDNAVRGPGVCSGMATANSMHVVCEALGMTLPGSAPVLAESPRMKAFARESGKRIVEMVLEDLQPRAIMTAGAFRNAVAAVLAVSGSINCIKHLQATAIETGVDIDIFKLFNDMGGRIPVLAAVKPNGDNTIEDFESAGGTRALLKQLSPLIETDVLTVTGKTLADNLAEVIVANDEVIRPLTRPFSTESPIIVLRGTLAEESAIVKLGIRDGRRKTRFTGPAIVFDDAPSALKAIGDGDVKPGAVLVVRGMGLKGGPAMAGSASRVVFALDAAGLSQQVAFVTDGQLSGLCNRGVTVAEVSPEAAVGGALGLVENGDEIAIDVDRKQIDLNVAAATLAARRARLGDVPMSKVSGYLSIYRRTVQPMPTGAVHVLPERDPGV